MPTDEAFEQAWSASGMHNSFKPYGQAMWTASKEHWLGEAVKVCIKSTPAIYNEYQEGYSEACDNIAAEIERMKGV